MCLLIYRKISLLYYAYSELFGTIEYLKLFNFISNLHHRVVASSCGWHDLLQRCWVCFSSKKIVTFFWGRKNGGCGHFASVLEHNKGAFTNYVGKILTIIDHLPTIFDGVALLLQKKICTVDISSTTYLSRLFNVVCEGPLYIAQIWAPSKFF